MSGIPHNEECTETYCNPEPVCPEALAYEAERRGLAEQLLCCCAHGHGQCEHEDELRQAVALLWETFCFSCAGTVERTISEMPHVWVNGLPALGCTECSDRVRFVLEHRHMLPPEADIHPVYDNLNWFRSEEYLMKSWGHD